jgi:3-oxoacyl-[acyl-carrier protein] reductase
MVNRANELDINDLHVGMKAQFEVDVDEKTILSFAESSGDYNPLHVDTAYAKNTKFETRIAHGAFQVGLASRMAGMYIPGRLALVTNFQAAFPTPLQYPNQVRVLGEVTVWNPETRTGRLKVVVETQQNQVTAEIYITFTFHELQENDKTIPVKASEKAYPYESVKGNFPWVLVTGASGGLGVLLVEKLLKKYRVIAVTRTHSLPPELDGREGVFPIKLNLASGPSAITILETQLPKRLYGVIHCAWPMPNKGGLLSSDDKIIDRHVSFGSSVTVGLARLLWNRVGDDGGRLVALGSDWGTIRPNVGLSAYSLGKATLEHTIRLLAAEMACKGITVNVISPNLMPIGMNKSLSKRQLLTLKAQIPKGRLCTASDVVENILFLLSPSAAYLSGQIIPLTGAQL